MSQITAVATKPYSDQKPGTSGLRKKVKVVQQPHYLENFIQSIFSCLTKETIEAEGSTLLISGDGRYYNKQAIQTACEIAAANGVKRVWIGRGGLMATPAASCVIREREGGVAFGGIILTASHNRGGPENDFGVKYNTGNGGPAQESLTSAMYEFSKSIAEYKIMKMPQIDLDTIGTQWLVPDVFRVEIIDPVEDWMALMKKLFDFDAIRSLVKRKDFTVCFDAMHGVAGPYANGLLEKELGCSPGTVINGVPSEDFGGGHPDPNLTYAHDLVETMKALKPEEASASTPDFGAAGDGDNDRNMILGRGFFVSPSDSVAVIAAYASRAVPYFSSGVKGVSRSMPTSCALDRVAAKLGLSVYEVPTGWKFFGNLMDAGKISICGEESFGTGSDHIREKDGLWAVLCWLSILAYRNRDASAPLVGVGQIVEEFWQEFGRCYYCRYDYEEVDAGAGAAFMKNLEEMTKDPSRIKGLGGELKLKTADNFTYKDPVDGSMSPNQGLRFIFEDGSRFVFRLSGTGSVGATVRVYFEKYEADPAKMGLPNETALRNLISAAIDVSDLEGFTGRKEPTVIT